MSVPSISIIDAGDIGSTVAGLTVRAGTSTQVPVCDASRTSNLSGVDVAQIGSSLTGDTVVLALPYVAIDEIITTYGAQAFADKVAVDPTSPLNSITLSSLVPAGSSAATELTMKLLDAHMIKAFNAAFAIVLVNGTIGARLATTLAASDFAEVETGPRSFVETAGLAWVDADELRQAERMGALGALNTTLGVTEQVG